jgi:hypothetical protein
VFLCLKYETRAMLQTGGGQSSTPPLPWVRWPPPICRPTARRKRRSLA